MKRDNQVALYGKGTTQLRLSARVHHTSPDHSTVYYKLNTRDLLYKSDGTGGPFRSVVRITYESYADWGSKQLLDSASTLIQDKSTDTNEDRELIGSMDLRRNESRSFIVRVTARDLNRDNESSMVLRVERDGAGSRQYFMPADTSNGLPLFDDHLRAGTAVQVRCESLAGRSLFGTRHPNSAALPGPVFSGSITNTADPRPDSTFTVTVDHDGRFHFAPIRPGIYHFRTDTSATAVRDGFTLFVLDQSYPWVDEAPDMLKPLRYITSVQEFDRMAKAADVRKAVERFWMDAAGDRERAREAIRIYYSRVENANRHFSALVEGWRTDRGLVHIIFGTPTTIYKSETNETWIYGEENNLMSLTFTFVKRKSAFSDNDLVLERDPMLRGAWYRNVESWRSGRVYQN
ncbi:MAG: GWxTD domain-containing protein [Flavobacteriales bacterium]|nr:GWxTD domain-containing protein [Flavobacteriales bacterium]